MKNSLKRFAATLACAALTIGLTLSAQAAEAPPIRVSSYKGTTLEGGERSGLIIGPSGAEYTVTSSDPDTTAVEQVMGFWVAVVKAEGSVEITAVNHAGESGTMTLTIGSGTPTAPTAPASKDNTSQPESLDVRQELIQSPQVKSGRKGIVKGRCRRKDFSQETLQPSPEQFNGIEFRRVGREKQNSASGILGSRK